MMVNKPKENKINHFEAAAAARELVLDALAGAPGPVKDVAAHLASSMGKGVRTLLLAYCAMDGDGIITRDSVRAAACIELLHMATLVHDDIIDDAAARRDMPSVQSRFGKERAVLGGDWLLCVAVNQALSIEKDGVISEKRDIAKALVRSAEKVCLGELEQRAHHCDVNLQPRRYIRIIDRKTAELFCLSAYAGSVTGGREDEESALLIRFARYLGLVFQIVDDIKDYSMDEADALKTVRNDLLSGVVTMPLIMGFMREPSLKPLAAEVMRSGLGANALICRVRSIKGADDAHGIAKAYAAKAFKILDRLADKQRRELLAGLLDNALGAAKKF